MRRIPVPAARAALIAATLSASLSFPRLQPWVSAVQLRYTALLSPASRQNPMLFGRVAEGCKGSSMNDKPGSTLAFGEDRMPVSPTQAA